MNAQNLQRRLAILRKNLYLYLSKGFNILMHVLYFGGIPLSILYGKSQGTSSLTLHRPIHQTTLPDVHVLLSNRKYDGTRENGHDGTSRRPSTRHDVSKTCIRHVLILLYSET